MMPLPAEVVVLVAVDEDDGDTVDVKVVELTRLEIKLI